MNRMNPIRSALLLLAGCAALGVAAPAHAEPVSAGQPGADQAAAVSDAPFIGALENAGITYTSPEQAITAAKAVCGLVDRGEPGLEIVMDLKANNPGFTTDGAARFAAIAAQAYCPHQLAAK